MTKIQRYEQIKKEIDAQPKLHRNMKRELRLWQRKWGFEVKQMKILFIALCIGWVASLVLWLYTIINKKHRKQFHYLYSLLVLQFFNLAISICSFFV